MNRSLDIRSQVHALIFDQHGRASIPTLLDVSSDFTDEDTRVECGCRDHDPAPQPAPRITHEILVSHDWYLVF